MSTFKYEFKAAHFAGRSRPTRGRPERVAARGPRALSASARAAPRAAAAPPAARHTRKPGRRDRWQVQGLNVEDDDQGVPPAGRSGARRDGSGRSRLQDIEYLELVAVPQVVTWGIALLALLVSVASYRLNLRDKRYAWEDQERNQAEEVAGWLAREMCEEHSEMEWKAYVRNGSKSPVYDVLYVIHDRADLDAAIPELIPVIPPDTTWDFFPTWFGGPPEGNPRVYMTFRDKRGNAWQRDTHGRLTPTRRPVDSAPPTDPTTGRISYGSVRARRRQRVAGGIVRRWIDKAKVAEMTPEPDGQGSDIRGRAGMNDRAAPEPPGSRPGT